MTERGRGGATGRRLAVGAAVIVGALLMVLNWNRSRGEAAVPASIVMNSQLLDADLPGTAPYPAGENRDAALAGAQEAARSLNSACMTDHELYLVTDELTALDALNRATQAQNYTRTTLLTTEQGVLFSLDGPKDLFVAEVGNALFICEI